MAKVASTSIYQSISNQCNIKPFHIHSLNDRLIKDSEAIALKHGIIPDSRQVGGLIYKHRLQSKKPIKIITCVRDLLDRNMSAFFEAFEYHTGVRVEDWNGSQAELLELFLDKLDHDYPIDWFEKEFQQMTGIDIYNLEFDTETKWSHHRIENIDLLILRTDLDDQAKSSVIADFLGCNTFQLKRYNEGAKKSYSSLYQSFRSTSDFGRAYLDKLYQSKIMTHFFFDNRDQYDSR